MLNELLQKNRQKLHTFNHFVHTLHSHISFPLTTQSNVLVIVLQFTSFTSITCKQDHCVRLKLHKRVLEVPQEQDQDRRSGEDNLTGKIHTALGMLAK